MLRNRCLNPLRDERRRLVIGTEQQYHEIIAGLSKQHVTNLDTALNVKNDVTKGFVPDVLAVLKVNLLKV